jgi:predicted ATPase/predicted Ser/Thr protein kinase
MLANRYQLGKELGAGGMGTVYLGTDSHNQHPVAIKRLKNDTLEPNLLERFRREGEALRELNHPNIVKLLDAFAEADQHYLVMEYVEGGDLNRLLDKGGIPLEQVLRLSIDLADALTRAHKLDIIHRDLKPANVLIADDGTLRLTDFGVARIGQKQRVTATNVIVGTVDYLAPESLDGSNIDVRADIWAFGVMLFEMVAGKRPFTGETLTATLTAILTHPVPDLEALRPDAPIALIDLIYRMLEKECDARISSVRHVGAELEDVLQGRRAAPITRFATTITDELEPPSDNLPVQTTPFVGREAELAELAKLLDDPKIRLITILAPGGMGKTRLSLAAAEKQLGKFTDGVYFVELAPLADSTNIISAIAEATGFQFRGQGTPKEQLLALLRDRNLLLVMDNYEHLLDGASLVTAILNTAADVQILATSRKSLGQPGEAVFHLVGMDFPHWEVFEDALGYAAVKLFMNSAQRAQPAFELTSDNINSVTLICRLVDGMPLGIVLAASWLAMLLPQEIANEIQQGIDFLADGIGQFPERQQSIHAVFDYSWRQMTEVEQNIFSKLSVFRGGFTRKAGQAITEASLQVLMTLVHKSLLRRNADSGRYEIHELLRQYGEEKLQQTGKLTPYDTTIALIS